MERAKIFGRKRDFLAKIKDALEKGIKVCILSLVKMETLTLFLTVVDGLEDIRVLEDEGIIVQETSVVGRQV